MSPPSMPRAPMTRTRMQRTSASKDGKSKRRSGTFQGTQRLLRLGCHGGIGVQSNDLLKFSPGPRRVIEFPVGEGQVKVIGLVVGDFLHGLFKDRGSNRIGTIIVISPAERVGGVGEVRKALTSGLGQGQRNVWTAPMLEH